VGRHFVAAQYPEQQVRPVPKEQDSTHVSLRMLKKIKKLDLRYTPRQVGAGIQVVRVEEGEVRV
jgi:hypothetical protein